MKREGSGALMKVLSFGLGITAVFVVLARTIYVESAAVACAYEIRNLREDEARLKNANDVMRADIANRRTVQALEQKAEPLGLIEVPLDAVRRVSTTREEVEMPLGQ